MATLLNKVMNFVGWEHDEEEMDGQTELKEETQYQHIYQVGGKKQQNNKVVNISSSSQMKVVIVQPQTMDDAQEICDHLKNKRSVVINLEGLDQKDGAQRILDFLCGAVYSLDGNIQKISNGIFIVAPFNVDISGDFKDEFKNKLVFPWIK